MSLTGSGNTWSKKNKYSLCPFCNRKGRYTAKLMAGEDIFSSTMCKYCEC